MIVNIHRTRTNNVGDLYCSPVRYIDELKNVLELDALGYKMSEAPSSEDRILWNKAVANANVIIVGGGGLLAIDFFADSLTRIFMAKKPTCKTILWGSGHNNSNLSSWRELKPKLDLTSLNFDLVGIRDDNQPYEWVPCVSCLDARFDVLRDSARNREVGLYVHERTLKIAEHRQRLPKGIDILDNDADFDTVLTYLASTELILTDSYHGAYWATLLGRKAVIFPWSSKFYDFRHSIPLCMPEDWKRAAKLSIVYPDALDECRAANRAFADKALDLIHKHDVK